MRQLQNLCHQMIVYNFNYLKWFYENNFMNVKFYKPVLSDMVIHISKWEKKNLNI